MFVTGHPADSCSRNNEPIEVGVVRRRGKSEFSRGNDVDRLFARMMRTLLERKNIKAARTWSEIGTVIWEGKL